MSTAAGTGRAGRSSGRPTERTPQADGSLGTNGNCVHGLHLASCHHAVAGGTGRALVGDVTRCRTSSEEPMKPRFVITAALAGLVATSAAQAQTQPVRGMSLELTPYAGYMMFGKMVEGPIGTSVSNANSPLYGAQLGLSLTPNIGLVGNVAYASSDLKI